MIGDPVWELDDNVIVVLQCARIMPHRRIETAIRHELS